MTKKLLIFISFLCVHFSFCQTIELNGLVIASDDVENVHVINKTSNKYSTTNSNGEFKIQAKQFDTIVFSSILYQIKATVISQEDIEKKSLLIELQDYVNALDEVVVGKILTGDLESDIENSEAKPKINFYDVGIPGYKGKPLTKREREYADASNGRVFSYYGIGFGINFYKLLNVISGRTKRLKNYVRLEKRDELMYRIRAQYSDIILGESNLEDHQKNDFFFFCSEDEKFMDISNSANDLLILEFLQEKHKTYLQNLKGTKD